MDGKLVFFLQDILFLRMGKVYLQDLPGYTRVEEWRSQPRM